MVGPREELGGRHLTATRVNWIAGAPPEAPRPLTVRIRHRHQDAAAIVTPDGDTAASVTFTDPQVASVGRTGGDELVSSAWKVDSTARSSTYERPKRPGLLKVFADPDRGVLVGAVAVGPESGEWLGQLTLAIRADVPVSVLRDTIQPYPTFSEAVFFAVRDLPL